MLTRPGRLFSARVASLVGWLVIVALAGGGGVATHLQPADSGDEMDAPVPYEAHAPGHLPRRVAECPSCRAMCPFLEEEARAWAWPQGSGHVPGRNPTTR